MPIEGLIAAFVDARAAIATLFALAHLDPTRTRETSRDLGINRGLAWRLTRIVRESEPEAVASDMPGAKAMGAFYDACRKRGVAMDAISAAATAVERFEAALAASSGDRRTLALVLANRSRSAGVEIDRARRHLFEGASGVWGVQAVARFVTVFVFPSPQDPSMLDAGHVTGFVGFRRLSAKPWPLSFEAVHHATGAAAAFDKEPLDPAGSGEGQLQLLKRFCSPQPPAIDVLESGGYKRFELAIGPVGNEGLTTCVFGTRLRRLYPRYSEQPDTAGFMVFLTTPVERVIFDMFVHRDLGVSAPPAAMLLDRLAFPHTMIESDFPRQSLPLADAPVALPDGLGGTALPLIPWYMQLVQYVTERLEKPITQFTGSRFEMAYPPISTVLRREIELKPR